MRFLAIAAIFSPLVASQATNWTLSYYKFATDCMDGTDPGDSITHGCGNQGCTPLTFVPEGGGSNYGSPGSFRLKTDDGTGGALSVKFYFDAACTDECTTIAQDPNDKTCYNVNYPFDGGPVNFIVTQAGA